MTEVFDCSDAAPADSGHRVGDQRAQGRPAGRAAHRHRVRHRCRRVRQRRRGGAARRPRAAAVTCRCRCWSVRGTPSTVWCYTVPHSARELIRAFWPGALSLVVRQAPSLQWDLGDAHGTVMLRMPLHPVAIELLREVGPMAVSSANISGRPAAVTAARGARPTRRSGRGLPRRRAVGPAGGIDDRRPHRRPSAGAAGGSGGDRGHRRGARRRRRDARPQLG